MTEDCDEVLAMLAEFELSLNTEHEYRETTEIEEADREAMILQCKKKQHDLLQDIEKHKKSCFIYNPNIFREP